MRIELTLTMVGDTGEMAWTMGGMIEEQFLFVPSVGRLPISEALSEISESLAWFLSPVVGSSPEVSGSSQNGESEDAIAGG